MRKMCVFCGARPSSKTKEHVVPQWLIKLTGDPDRKVRLGIDFRKKNHRPRIFRASSLHFPACEKCNSNSSKFESRAKDVVSKVLANVPLEAHEMDVFLDWLDKIRVGIWLGMKYLDGNLWSPQPAFHIETRIGVWDRMVAIYACETEQNDLALLGVQTPVFRLMPSCFVLRVRDFFFFNVSAEFLVSRRTGFPYPKEIFQFRGSPLIGFNMKPGRRRVMKPIIRKSLSPGLVSLYQPVVRRELRERFPELYTDTYVKEHMLAEQEGKGNVLVERLGDVRWLRGKLRIVDHGASSRKPTVRKLIRDLSIQTLRFQTYLNKDHYSLALVEPKVRIKTRRRVSAMESAHNVWISKIREHFSG